MESGESVFQLALKEANEQLSQVDVEYDVLNSKLKDVTDKKTILLSTRLALQIQVGEVAPPEPLSFAQAISARSKNHFKGMGMAAAARKHLAEVGHAQTHAQVLEALLKGNFKTQSKHPSGSLRTAMQKRPDWFRWVKRPADRGRWELVEWPIHDENPMAPPTAAAPSLALVQ
ncbi:MAG TPA: hypothetical protein DC054_09290 [Blastocatellia bacterium]|nr:hypothetical protein [Blastocatellia bacterium]